MKYINKYISVLLFSLLAACNLDPELTTQYPEEQAFANEKNFNFRIYGFYENLRRYGSGIGSDAMADLIKINENFNTYNYHALGLNLITPQANVLADWNGRYSGIRQCNEFLYDLEKYRSMLPENIAIRGEAEIRFFRAFLYFDLAKWHGGRVPLLKELTSESKPLCGPEECWDFIAEDLDFAAKHLPKIWDPENRGRITKGGAFGMKARAMLYAQRWQEAVDATDSVISFNTYTLVTPFADLFKTKNRFNSEAVIEGFYKAPELTTSWFDQSYALPSDPEKSNGKANPTEECVSEFQMADGTTFDWNNPEHKANPYVGREERFYASILYNGAEWKKDFKTNFPLVCTYVGAKYDDLTPPDGFVNMGNLGTVTGYYIKKLLDESLKTYSSAGEMTHMEMRYAEVLLIRAEAMAELDNIPEALKSLQEVRDRAGLSANPVTAANKTEFMRLLRHERIVELAFEGHRYWDLRRWDLAKTVLNDVSFHGCKITKNGENYTYTIVDCDQGFKRYYDPKYNRFPIPAAELNKNLNCEQFSEWGSK